MQKHQEHKDLWQKNMGQKNEGVWVCGVEADGGLLCDHVSAIRVSADSDSLLAVFWLRQRDL